MAPAIPATPGALAHKVDRNGEEHLRDIIDRALAASMEASPTPADHWAVCGTDAATWANGLKFAKRRSTESQL